MKFSLASFASLAATCLSSTMAAPIETCGQQADCVQFSLHKITDEVCGGDCYYNICMKISLTGDCVKDDDISHTCVKDPDTCSDTLGFTDAAETGDIGNGFVQCQRVPVGGQAEFLLKDGNAEGCGQASVSFLTDCTANCETYPVKSCTGNGNIGRECVWTVDAPQNCNKNGGGFGDPHIKRWDQKRFDFHGECDLVLLHSDHVNGNMPLDLHIRTRIQGHFSYIESTALKVGDTIFQLDSDKFFVNDKAYLDDTALPLALPEFTIEAVNFDGAAKIYTVVLTDHSTIKFKVIKKFLSVSVSGHEEDFGESTGLLGDYHSGEALGRDGRLMDDFIEYGLEWQVLEGEPKLFRELGAPQRPESSCIMPIESATSRRRLLRNKEDAKFYAMAADACSLNEEFDSCMEDVLATGDLDLAGAW